VRAFDAMVDNFIASYAGKAPGGLVLDLDPTACIVYGQQELGMFSTHVGDTCLMPFHLDEGQSARLIASALHPGKTPTAKAILGILRRVVKKLRRVWPRLPLIFRADSYHSKPEVPAWLKREGLRYVIGCAPNAVLKRQFAECISAAGRRYERHLKEGRAEVEARTFASGSYSAGSWGGKARRIICRAIAGPHGVDQRYIVTDFEQHEAVCPRRENRGRKGGAMRRGVEKGRFQRIRTHQHAEPMQMPSNPQTTTDPAPPMMAS